MKISPVNGTPTIPNHSNSGNSPEKLARLKAIAAGESPIGVTEREEDKDKHLPLPSHRAITMRTNRTVDRYGEPQVPEPEIEAAPETTQTAISDEGVQANETAEVTQPLSPQLAALAKQRRALQVKEREIAEREKALSGPSRADLEAKLKSSPLSVLQELGVTYDQLTQEILASQGEVNPDIQALKAEIKALKEGVDKTLSDKDTAAEQAVLAEMRRNVDRLSAQGDDYELIRETGSQQDVLDLIHKTWKESGEVMDEAEAMKLIEEELVTESLKIAKFKKVQGKLTPTAPLQQQPQHAMRTLTNKDSASPAMSRRQRAIQAALGNLKR